MLCDDGRLLVGDIPADAPWGKCYLQKKAEGHPFYSHARFFTVNELVKMLREAGLAASAFASSLTQLPHEAPRAELPQPRRIGDAGFVCILAEKF